jgi:hypothetical protein
MQSSSGQLCLYVHVCVHATRPNLSLLSLSLPSSNPFSSTPSTPFFLFFTSALPAACPADPNFDDPNPRPSRPLSQSQALGSTPPVPFPALLSHPPLYESRRPSSHIWTIPSDRAPVGGGERQGVRRMSSVGYKYRDIKYKESCYKYRDIKYKESCLILYAMRSLLASSSVNPQPTGPSIHPPPLSLQSSLTDKPQVQFRGSFRIDHKCPCVSTSTVHVYT